MFSTDFHEQTIISYAQGGYLGISVESFLIDRQAASLSRHTLNFYRQSLNPFITYCNANSLTLIQEISPDFLRRYFLGLSETHNPGGVHAAYRTLRAFFRWLMLEEVMPAEWKNPMLRVKPPKVALEPLEPISLEDVRALIGTCQRGKSTGDRDRAVFLFLLDTGARGQELCNTTMEDADLNAGSVMIRYGKGGKSRTVFLGRKTRRALRSYLHSRHDHSNALFLCPHLGTALPMTACANFWTGEPNWRGWPVSQLYTISDVLSL